MGAVAAGRAAAATSFFFFATGFFGGATACRSREPGWARGVEQQLRPPPPDAPTRLQRVAARDGRAGLSPTRPPNSGTPSSRLRYSLNVPDNTVG
jgi:hypothetical protein